MKHCPPFLDAMQAGILFPLAADLTFENGEFSWDWDLPAIWTEPEFAGTLAAGIPFSAPRSTNHSCWPDFSGIAHRMGHGDLQPNYNVCFLRGDDVVIHSIDFLDQHKVRWQETTDEGWITDPDTVAAQNQSIFRSSEIT